MFLLGTVIHDVYPYILGGGYKDIYPLLSSPYVMTLLGNYARCNYESNDFRLTLMLVPSLVTHISLRSNQLTFLSC